jgi:hypothetical protein
MSDAEEALRAAMNRYGLTDADRGHNESVRCWCGPDVKCGRCGAGVCACGVAYVIVHRRSS